MSLWQGSIRCHVVHILEMDQVEQLNVKYNDTSSELSMMMK